MYARAVDDAATRLRDLRREEWGDFGLGVLFLALGAAAADVRPAWALPLFVGGLVVWCLGVRALWRRWDLVDRLSGESDAYVISEVLAYAAREATMERRRSFAAMIRATMSQPDAALEGRVEGAATQLDELVSELEDEELALDPASAVACMRLLSDLTASPLLNPAVPPEELRSRILQIRAGFQPRRLAPYRGRDARGRVLVGSDVTSAP